MKSVLLLMSDRVWILITTLIFFAIAFIFLRTDGFEKPFCLNAKCVCTKAGH
jgi:hypothetical protein